MRLEALLTRGAGGRPVTSAGEAVQCDDAGSVNTEETAEEDISDTSNTLCINIVLMKYSYSHFTYTLFVLIFPSCGERGEVDHNCKISSKIQPCSLCG